MPALALASTLASLLLNAYGSSQSQKATEKAQALNQQRINDLTTWYESESSKDYTQTAEGKSTLGRLENQMDKILSSQASNAVKTGATPESRVATQGELQERYADAISRLSGLTTQRKDNLRRDYTTQLNQLLNNEAGMIEGEQTSWANLAQNISSALGSLSQASVANTTDGNTWDWLTDLFNSGKYTAGSGSGQYANRGF